MLPYIPIDMARAVRVLLPPQSCIRSSGEQQDRQGSALTSKGKVLPEQSKVSRACLVTVIRVSHREVITNQVSPQ